MTYAVCVTFMIQQDQVEAFLPLMVKNAHASLVNEDGCLQFDVLTDPSRPKEVFLYELYKDLSAFQAHLASDHFCYFDAATAPMIAGKEVKTYVQVKQ
jgi:quinol monooxygenase YgiN